MHRSRERREFQNLYPHMYPGKTAKVVTFIVTHQCNLRCTYCYETNKGDERMSLETAKACVDLLFREDEASGGYINSDNADAVILDFIGGEPLLETKLMDEIVSYFLKTAIKHGHRWAIKYMISISSNGTLYRTPEVQRFLKKYKGRVSLNVTLDGDKETHDRCRVDCNGCGSYDKAADAFGDLVKRGLRGTKFTISPDNVDRVFTACSDMIERFGATELFCNCVYEEGWNEALAATLYEELKRLADWLIDTRRHEQVYVSILDWEAGTPMPESDTQNWCGGTGKMLAFGVDGTVYPCLRYAPMSLSKRSPLRIGDVDSGIACKLDDKATVEMLDSITRQSQSSEECLKCPIARGCSWCSGYNYEVYGTPNKRATFICPMHKARVMAMSYYHNHIYQLHESDERFPMNVPREWAVPIVGEDEYEYLCELAQPDGKKVLEP